MNMNRQQRRAVVMVLVSIIVFVLFQSTHKNPANHTKQQARLEMLERLMSNAEMIKSPDGDTDIVKLNDQHDYTIHWIESSDSANPRPYWLAIDHYDGKCRDYLAPPKKVN